LAVSAQAAGGARSVVVAVLKPNTTHTPIAGQVNLTQHDYVLMSDGGNGQWTGNYTNFTFPGEYQLIAYGWDADGSPAQPAEKLVTLGAIPTTTVTVTPTVTLTPSLTPTVTPVPTSTLQPRTYLPGLHR
jgi:hypothetical protein